MQFKKEFYEAKVIVLGDSGVGKSSIIFSALEQKFKFEMPTTLGSQFKMKKVKSTSNVPIKLKLVDTAGQQRFKSITNQYYKGSNAALIVFGLDNPDSFKNVKHWIRQVKINAGDNVYKLVLGNKLDLEEGRKVSSENVKELSEETGVQFLEVSAMTRENIERAIQTLTDRIAQENNLDEQYKGKKQELGQSVILGLKEESSAKSKKCC